VECAYLAEGHADGAVIAAGGQARGGTLAGRRGDARLVGQVGLLAGAGTATEEAGQAAELAGPEALGVALVGAAVGTASGTANVVLDTDRAGGAIVLWCGTGTHEVGDHGLGKDVTVALRLAERRAAVADVAVADDGGVGLRAAAIAAAVAGGAVGDLWVSVLWFSMELGCL
jgi:hypothetical protein